MLLRRPPSGRSQRALNAIEHALDEAGPSSTDRGSLWTQRYRRGRVPPFLIDLDGGFVAPHFDNFTDEAVTAHDPYDVEHVGVANTRSYDKGPETLNILPSTIYSPSFFHLFIA
jgi:hypothetical protein